MAWTAPDAESKRSVSRSIDPRLIRAAPTLRRYLSILVATGLLGAVLIVVQAVALATAIAGVFSRREVDHRVLVALGLVAGAGLARAALAGSTEFLGARASARVRADLRVAVLDSIVRLGPSWTRRQVPGDLVNASGPGLDGLDGYLTRALPALISASLIPPVVLVTIAWFDWQSGVALLVMLPLVPIFMILIGITTKRRVQQRYELLGRLAGQFVDLLRGLTTLQVYGRVRDQERTLRKVTTQYRTETMGALRVAFLSALVLDLVAALSVAVIAVDVGLRLDAARLSFATALSVLILAPELFAPLRILGLTYHATEEGRAAADAALAIVDEAGEPTVASRIRRDGRRERPTRLPRRVTHLRGTRRAGARPAGSADPRRPVRRARRARAAPGRAACSPSSSASRSRRPGRCPSAPPRA